jgi:carboxypeptidase T
MRKQILLVLIVSVACCKLVTGQEKYSKVRIPVVSSVVADFIRQQLNPDHFDQQSGLITIVLNTAEMNRLRNSGYAFELVTDDVVQHTLDQNRYASPLASVVSFQDARCRVLSGIIPVPASFGNGGSLRLGASAANPGYFTYAEMIAEMQSLQLAYPALVSLFSIGNSANGNPIYAVKISDNVNVDEPEPEVLYTGLQHAREAIGGTSLVFFMQFLAEQYAQDNRIKNMVDNRAIYIVPCVNPDGYMYNYSGASASYPTSGGGLWRKNRRNTGGGAGNIGVDLNRNYGIDWSNCSGASTSCGSSNKTEDTYYGPAAFSEPETQAIRNFVQSRRFVNAIDQHCYGPYYSLPYGRPTLHPALSTEDEHYYTRIPALMGLYNGHRAGNSPQTVNYEVAGGIKDWLLLGDIGSGPGPKGKIFGMTGEAGGGDFWAPVSQIIPLCRELCFQNIQLANAAGGFYELEDMNDIGISCVTGRLKFSVQRIGLHNDPVTVSLIPIENMLTAGLPVTHTLNNYGELITDSIEYTLPPLFGGGQKIKYAWKTESGGVVHYDTIIRYFNPISMLADNMEGSFNSNWNAGISPAGPAGWAFTNLQSFDGNSSMTESPSGNYTASSTRTVTCKHTFNLSDAIAANLSFWVKHRSENFRDKLQIQVATDGSNWTPICGINTIRESNTTSGGTLGNQPALTGIREQWTHEYFDLDDFIGQPSLSFRLQFTSDNDAGSFAFEKDDGFYIDNLRLIKVSAITTLPVKFGNFTAQLMNDETVRLDWEAFIDQQHHHFEVERKTEKDPVFRTISTINNLPPYFSFDFKPEEGNNYYRIKEVDKAGRFSYSNIVNIHFAPGYFSSVIYPNPAKEVLGIKITDLSLRENFNLMIFDPAGRKVLEQTILAGSGTAMIKVDISKLPAQMYLVKLTNKRRQIILRQKFLKE